MKLFSYWEGLKPVYIQMCQEILLKKCPDVVIASEYDKHNDWPIHLKVDVLKANLIYEQGGFWIDADMIVMKDLTPIFDMLKDYEFVGIPGFFGARKGAPIMKRWIDGINKRISEGNLTFSDLIQPILHDLEFKEFEPLTREMICPIYNTEIEKFFQPRTKEYDPYVVTLNNSAFPDWFQKMSREEILSKDWLISDFFRKALE
jgi:hypothetical protein